LENQEQLQDLLKRYLANQCTPTEIKTLLVYFQSGEDNVLLKKLIEEKLNDTITADGYSETEIQSSVDEVYHALIHKIQTEDKPYVKKIRIFNYSRVAAALLFLVGAASVLFYFSSQNVDSVKMMKVVTTWAERKQIKLADGSHVWLGPASSLECPERFTGNQREVKLKGEAFFEVAKDKNHPFIIHSGNINTKVLGTSFNIKAYQDQADIVVTVLTGKVAVRNPEKHAEINLLPYQRGVFNKLKQSLVKEDDPDAVKLLAERVGDFDFNGTPVKDILHKLQVQYNIQVIVKGDIESCSFYGTLRKDENANRFLTKMCKAINAGLIKIAEDEYIIKSKGCKMKL